MSKRNLNKKAQVGITINWMVAFIIIFFMVLIFVGISAIASGKRQLNKNDISSIKEGFDKLEAQRMLITFLNTPVEFKEEKINFRELILKWGENQGLKGEVEAKLTEYFKDKTCYALIVYDSKKSFGNLFVNRGSIQKSGPVTGLVNYGAGLIDERWGRLILIKGEIKLEVYYLDCENVD